MADWSAVRSNHPIPVPIFLSHIFLSALSELFAGGIFIVQGAARKDNS